MVPFGGQPKGTEDVLRRFNLQDFGEPVGVGEVIFFVGVEEVLVAVAVGLRGRQGGVLEGDRRGSAGVKADYLTPTPPSTSHMAWYPNIR